MDYILNSFDIYLFTPYFYPKSWDQNWWLRQFISLLIIVNIFGYLMYLTTATISFYTLFDRQLLKHPKLLPNQVRSEILLSLKSMPLMSIPTCLLFLTQIRGHSRLYDQIHQYGIGYFITSILSFLLFTDCCIYFIHRILHWPNVYKHLHKSHHQWIIPTPFASHAFHPIDGFLQSSPYHLFVILFPLHKILYLILFTFVNLWTVLIHDGNDMIKSSVWQKIINGSAHHTDHHLFFNYNYGQFFTLWDWLCGSHRIPSMNQKNIDKVDKMN